MADWATDGDWAFNNDWEGVQKTGALSLSVVSGTSVAGASARLGAFSDSVVSDFGVATSAGHTGTFGISQVSTVSGTGLKGALAVLAIIHGHDIATTGTSINLSGSFGISLVETVTAGGEKAAAGDFGISENITQEFIYVPTIIITTPETTYRNNVADGPLSRKVALGTKGYR